VSRLPLPESSGGGRFPGFDVMAQARHWDAATTSVVAARLAIPPAIRFFTPGEEAIASALCDQLLDQRTEPRVPVVQVVDARLAEHQTDGWHYDDMPPDGAAWRESLANLEADAELRCGTGFAACGWLDQTAIVQNVQDLGDHRWHRLVAAHVWSLWTRYVCTAFYAHPFAWEEIGFGGPAYPRGYKNLGIDRREPYEVRDARPADDPTAGSAG
jgi:hypothetical protein